MDSACESKQQVKLSSRLRLSLIVGAVLGVFVFALEVVFRAGQGYAFPTRPYDLLRFLIGVAIYAIITAIVGLAVALVTEAYYFATRRCIPAGHLLAVLYSSAVVACYAFIITAAKINSHIQAKRTEPISFLADGLILIGAIILYVVLYSIGRLAVRKCVRNYSTL